MPAGDLSQRRRAHTLLVERQRAITTTGNNKIVVPQMLSYFSSFAGERVSECAFVFLVLRACVFVSVRGLGAEWVLLTSRRMHILIAERQRANTTVGNAKNRSAADAFIFSHHCF